MALWNRPAASATSYVCLPSAVGVFGLDGPPDWTAAGVAAHPIGKQLDDPRWNGSVSDDLPLGVGMPEATFRGLQDGTKLYLTFRDIVDPLGSVAVNYSSVYVGFASATTGVASLFRFTFTQSNVMDTTDFAATTWQRSAAGVWSNGPPPPAWMEEPHVWAGPGTGTAGAQWALNVRVDLASLNSLFGANARFFYAINDYVHVAPPPPLAVAIVWPLGTAFSLIGGPGVDCGATPNDPTCIPSTNPSAWGTILVGTTDPNCPAGISLVPEHIGTMPISGAGIPSTTVEYGSDAGDAGNTFVAIMDYPDGSPPPATNSVKANFRLADWGSQIGDSTADWKSIIPAGAPLPVNGAQGDRIMWPCHETTGALDSCPTLPNPTAPTDQCMLVELASTGGVSPVHFVQDSARRNLDFVHASRFTRGARISINGLSPLAAGGGKRDVYIYVKTTNLPASVVPPSPVRDAGPPPDDAGAPPSDAGPVLGRPVGKAARGKRPPATGSPIYQKTVFESLRDSNPTYEVHVYHTTGRKIGSAEILEPQVPFGYIVDHVGTIQGWTHQLQARGVSLEQISPNFFHVKVADNGAIVVHTTIEAVEPPPPPPPPPAPHGRCNCDVIGGTGWSPLAMGLVGLGASALVLRSRRRNRGRSSDERR